MVLSTLKQDECTDAQNQYDEKAHKNTPEFPREYLVLEAANHFAECRSSRHGDKIKFDVVD